DAHAELVALGVGAKSAAADKRWVYPPIDYPEAATAYRLLLELEAFDVEDAERIGQDLRDEFATNLLQFGDAYWDRPGGRGFAREFYAQVLVFDPDHPLARERSGLSPSGSSVLRERAASGRFEAHELLAVAPLAALAEADADARLARLELLAEDLDRFPASIGSSLRLLVDDLERELPDRSDPTEPPPVDPAPVCEL